MEQILVTGLITGMIELNIDRLLIFGKGKYYKAREIMNW
jgi:hypothetical protein